MPQRAVIENWDEFTAFMVAQPLCQWSIRKQQDMSAGKIKPKGKSSIHEPASPKNDNADLAAALASMA